MIQDQTLESICTALQSRAVVDFVHASVKSGYGEFYSEHLSEINGMVNEAFDRLVDSQSDGINRGGLAAAAADLIEGVFRKGDERFWFNVIYHRYKTQLKPELDYLRLKPLIAGRRVLDYGCGSGYLSARLARGGFQVFTTDVLDYRYPEALHLPFVQMASPVDVPYPPHSIDTALVQAVLHHIDRRDLPIVIRNLAQTAEFVLIKEDTFDLSPDLPSLVEVAAGQSLLRRFMALEVFEQYRALCLIDFFANAIAQGIPEMNMPFEFRSVTDWRNILEANGLAVSQALVAGFEPGRMHKSCHVWFFCQRG